MLVIPSGTIFPALLYDVSAGMVNRIVVKDMILFEEFQLHHGKVEETTALWRSTLYGGRCLFFPLPPPLSIAQALPCQCCHVFAVVCHNLQYKMFQPEHGNPVTVLCNLDQKLLSGGEGRARTNHILPYQPDEYYLL